MNSLQPPVEFQNLLTDFIAELGQRPADDEALEGLEFASGEHVLRVGLHPGQADTLVLEVDVLNTLADGAAAPWRSLHQFNHEALLGQGWLASLDEDGQLVMTLQHPLAGVDVGTLQALMSEGLDQAEALAQQWRGLAPEAVQADAGLAPDALPFAPNMLLG
jgi:hypothetical protein